MSLASVLTMGFQPAGDVSSIVLLGYAQTGEAPPPPPTPDDTPARYGPAWYGWRYPGQSKPWWIRDLRDKERALERIRQQRIELGILPAEAKQIEQTIEEVDDFLAMEVSDANADEAIRRYDAISARVERVLDEMQEREDEAFVMQALKKLLH